MKVLYQVNLFEDSKIEYNINDLIKEQLEVENQFVNDCVEGVIKNKKDIVELANKYLKDWTIDRLDNLGTVILRMAIYEINYTDTPKIVVINEAIELAKKYSDENVRKMINAVLDKIVND